MNLTRTASAMMLLALLLMGAACFVNLARGTTTKNQNSLGVVISPINPNIAIVGSLVSGEMVEDADGRQGTSIRIHPVDVYSFYDEGIVFCGDESARVTNDGHLLKGDLVFIYRREAPRLIEGVPCFTLRAVYKADQLKGKK